MAQHQAVQGDRRSSARVVELNSWKGSLSRTETGSETRARRQEHRATGDRALQYRNSVEESPSCQ
jgi:hypothetical protein